MSPSQFDLQDYDEENSKFPRWNLLLTNHSHPHHPSQSVLKLKWCTRDDGKWAERNALRRTVHLDFTVDEIEASILASVRLPEFFPDDCLGSNQVHTHGGYSPTRSDESSVICRSISFVIDGDYNSRFYIRKDSKVWTESPWAMKVLAQVTPHLTEAPWRNRVQRRNLP